MNFAVLATLTPTEPALMVFTTLPERFFTLIVTVALPPVGEVRR